MYFCRWIFTSTRCEVSGVWREIVTHGQFLLGRSDSLEKKTKDQEWLKAHCESHMASLVNRKTRHSLPAVEKLRKPRPDPGLNMKRTKRQKRQVCFAKIWALIGKGHNPHVW